ncbi:MAG TPA: asparagine synthase-related protein [Gemmatimonadaceae bacterium]|nr:asparagine synthase-related protein [Gemmatimonadaceae bacterium]
MSSILGVFDPFLGATDSRQLSRMLAAMAHRGADCTLVRHVGSGALAVARCEWELSPTHAGPVMIAEESRVTVAADASLFYRADLTRKLRYRGVTPAGDTPSHLILAAYQAWGSDCVRELEGDFAFIVWDEPRRSVFAARDFTGKRPLYFTEAGDTLLAASSLAALQAHTRCARELDLAVIAEEAAVLAGTASETCWRGVHRLPPGHCLQWRLGDRARVVPYWDAPLFADRDSGQLPFDDAAEELRRLLTAAMDERLAKHGTTALFLSGGWDSPSLYATGQRMLSDARDNGRRLEAVSVSFPEGDPGREDEVISSIVGYWEGKTKWIRSSDIPPLVGVLERAARRDEPFPHLFEMMNRALARAGRTLGARVVLDGNGGDQLFQASSAYLTDLFTTGRWPTFTREWHARGGGDWRELLRCTLLPALSASTLHRIADARGGRPVLHTLERPLPSWIRPSFAREHSLLERERSNVLRRHGRSRAARESAWQLTRPLIGRMTAALGGLALEEGVEHRSPFTDARIVAFAASRPVLERRSGRETKRLLRRAMKGLLPDSALAPRPYRTGSPIRYLTNGIVAIMPSLIERTMTNPVLGDLGIIEPGVYRRMWEESVRRDDLNLCVSLYLTMEVELWLRARATHGSERGRSPLQQRARLAFTG